MLDETSLPQRLVAEFFGTAFLVFVGVGAVPATLIVNGGTNGGAGGLVQFQDGSDGGAARGSAVASRIRRVP